MTQCIKLSKTNQNERKGHVYIYHRLRSLIINKKVELKRETKKEKTYVYDAKRSEK